MSLVIQTWLVTGIPGAGKTTTSAALAAGSATAPTSRAT